MTHEIATADGWAAQRQNWPTPLACHDAPRHTGEHHRDGAADRSGIEIQSITAEIAPPDAHPLRDCPKVGPTIVIDTREQAPYSFGGRVATVRRGLKTGDYSLLGYETIISVERKTVDDYVGSLTRGRDRFLRECGRLAAFQVRAIVVEGSLSDLAEARYTSHATPQSIVGSTIKLITDFGLPVIFADHRWLAEVFVERMLVRHWEHAQGDRNAA
jgi:ERCC4-type nuclease